MTVEEKMLFYWPMKGNIKERADNTTMILLRYTYHGQMTYVWRIKVIFVTFRIPRYKAYTYIRHIIQDIKII